MYFSTDPCMSENPWHDPTSRTLRGWILVRSYIGKEHREINQSSLCISDNAPPLVLDDPKSSLSLSKTSLSVITNMHHGDKDIIASRALRGRKAWYIYISMISRAVEPSILGSGYACALFLSSPLLSVDLQYPPPDPTQHCSQAAQRVKNLKGTIVLRKS